MATALIVIPIAGAAALELGVSPQPVLMCVTVAAAASFLTPVATPVNMMVMGPAGYRFGDYWKLGTRVHGDVLRGRRLPRARLLAVLTGEPHLAPRSHGRPRRHAGREANVTYELFIALVTLLSMIVLALYIVLPGEQVDTVLFETDAFICVIFLLRHRPQPLAFARSPGLHAR